MVDVTPLVKNEDENVTPKNTTPVTYDRLPKGEMKKAALAYAKRGIRIFPCFSITPAGACSCGNAGCTSAGKHPRPGRGYHAATNKAAAVDRWWSQYPDDNIGMACQANGMVVIDVDPRHDGDKTLAALEAEHGALTSRLMADTGGGGTHIGVAFSAPPEIKLKGRLGQGIDVKYNGYILVAPSNHISGKRYAWQAGKTPKWDEDLGVMNVEMMPKWLREATVETGSSKADKSKKDGVPGPEHFRMPIARVRDMLFSIPNGDTDDEAYDIDRDAWLSVMFATHSASAGSYIALGHFIEWTRQHSSFDKRDETASEAKIVNQWRNAKLKAGGVTGKTLEAKARACGYDGFAWDAVEDPDDPPEGARDAAQPAVKPHKYETRAMIADRVRHPIEWLVDEMIEARTLFVIHGREKTGKTMLATDIAYHVAYGREWAGMATKRTGVLYVCLEGKQGFARRQDAWHLRQATLGFPEDRGPIETRRQFTDMFSNDTHLNEIVAQIRTFKERHGVECGLVIFDTLRQTAPGANENDQKDIGIYTSRLIRLRDACSVAVGFVHHETKDPSRGASGSTAITANVDAIFSVKVDAKGLKLVPEAQRDTDFTKVIRFKVETSKAGVNTDGVMEFAGVAVIAQQKSRVLTGEEMGAVTKDDERADDLGTMPTEAEVVADAETAKRRQIMTEAVRELLALDPTGCTARSIDDNFNAKIAKGKTDKAKLREVTLRGIRADMVEAGLLVSSGGTRPKFSLSLKSV